MFGLKTGAGKTVDRRPQLSDGEIVQSIRHVFAQMLAAVEKVANNRVNHRVDTPKPWFWL